MEYEVYMEKFLITMWRDDAVYRTESKGCDWFLDSVVKANKPRLTNGMYVAASDKFAETHSTIRRRHE